MAKELIVRIRDDLDGNVVEEFETLPFTYRGVAYEIVLSTANVELMDKTMKQFIDAGRKVVKSHKKAKSAPGTHLRPPTPELEQARRIRLWANESGFQVAPQGAIAAWVLKAFAKAHPDERMLVHPVKMPKSKAEAHDAKPAKHIRARMSKRQRDVVRVWANANGYAVAERGYIPDEVLLAHHDRKAVEQ